MAQGARWGSWVRGVGCGLSGRARWLCWLGWRWEASLLQGAVRDGGCDREHERGPEAQASRGTREGRRRSCCRAQNARMENCYALRCPKLVRGRRLDGSAGARLGPSRNNAFPLMSRQNVKLYLKEKTVQATAVANLMVEERTSTSPMGKAGREDPWAQRLSKVVMDGRKRM